MYSDDDLNLAVKKGIFTHESVEAFRTMVAACRLSRRADEENVRVVSGFNDIFVVIACAVLLSSCQWALSLIYEPAGWAFAALLSWLLAELFVIRRRLALPAICLLLSYTGGLLVASYTLALFRPPELNLAISSLLLIPAIYLHWLRFMVPVSVAAGCAAFAGFLFCLIKAVFPAERSVLWVIMLGCGVLVFMLAMYWDASDIARQTANSDVAFWLHCLAAPLIIHPVFLALDIHDNGSDTVSALIIMLLYLFMCLLSIVADRRIFMVSALAYVLYALSAMANDHAERIYGVAATGMMLGLLLLMLSLFWAQVRALVVRFLPAGLQALFPPADIGVPPDSGKSS